jgi:uncharacterized radical SAM superfamily protein
MNGLLEMVSKDEIEEYMRKALKVKLKNFDRKIYFYTPSFMYYKSQYFHSSSLDFPIISITGSNCALKCKHCGGRVLDTMYSVTNPEKLLEFCLQLDHEGSAGCLVSGGCQPDGSIPLSRFMGAIEEIKKKSDLTLIVHTGIIDLETARQLRNAGVDAALIDIIGSDDTIKEIYRLNTTITAYEDSLKSLRRAGIPFIPHIIVGLHNGKLIGELNALKMVSKYKPSALVIIAFLPIKGTEMQDISPPEPTDIAKIIAASRLILPETPLALGCMRPKGKHRLKTDILAIKSGVNAIAFPIDNAIGFARKMEYEIIFSPVCCSQIYSDIIHT